MIVKGEIQALSPTYDEAAPNLFSVRIDLFETVTGSGKVIVDCQVINQPGRLGGYQIGDAVWVAFEKDKYDLPVIIGKVYKGVMLEEEAYKSGNHLWSKRVDDIIAKTNAVLPITTVFSMDPMTSRTSTTSGNSGAFSAQWLYQQIEDLKSENASLRTELNELKQRFVNFPWTGA